MQGELLKKVCFGSQCGEVGNTSLAPPHLPYIGWVPCTRTQQQPSAAISRAHGGRHIQAFRTLSAAQPCPPPASLRSLPQILEATRELVTEANLEVGATGISLQAMDSSHVSLVALSLRSDGFEHYRADRSFSMGMNLNNVSKMLRCAGKDDIITIKADDGDDTVYFTFESPSEGEGGAGWHGMHNRLPGVWTA